MFDFTTFVCMLISNNALLDVAENEKLNKVRYLLRN